MTDRGHPDPAVLNAALEVSRRLDLVECFQVLIQAIGSLTGEGVVLGYRYSDSGFDLDLVASSVGEDHPLRNKLALLDARVLDDEVPLEGRHLDDLTLIEPASGWGDPTPGSALALPLSSSDERVGLVLFLDPPSGEPASRIRDLVRECGPAVRSALTVRDLKELMVRDDTADCFNRRYFDEYLTGEVARAVRFGGRLALIFLDMDNLKDVNTRHGHAAGSQVLYEASVRINRSIRTVDKLFRFGGDEFCIVLPETDAPGANEVAERVRRELSGKPFLTETTPGEPLTASFGVSAFPEHGRNAASLLEAADRAMRQIKDGCKNAIATAGEGKSVPEVR